MSFRTDAALTRRVAGARLVVSTAVLGGAFGDLTGGGSHPGQVGGPVSVELSEAVSTR